MRAKGDDCFCVIAKQSHVPGQILTGQANHTATATSHAAFGVERRHLPLFISTVSRTNSATGRCTGHTCSQRPQREHCGDSLNRGILPEPTKFTLSSTMSDSSACQACITPPPANTRAGFNDRARNGLLCRSASSMSNRRMPRGTFTTAPRLLSTSATVRYRKSAFSWKRTARWMASTV